jgi:hypothetical protein
MGWTSCYKWYSPTVLRREYEADIAKSGKIQTFGWCGSFLKCLHVPTGRPFLVDVMVRKFGKREYGYKDVEVSSGPYKVNQSAARWLRRELAKRGLTPEYYEASWLLWCDRSARHSQWAKSLKEGDVIVARKDFTVTSGREFKAGDRFTFRRLKGGRIHCTPEKVSWPLMSLTMNIFCDSYTKDYAVVTM